MRAVPACFLPVLLLLAACASTPRERIAKNPGEFAQYPAAVQEKIRAGQVEVGFTRGMVLLALGEPDRRRTRTAEEGVSEVWVYLSHRPHFSFGVAAGSGGYSSVGGGVTINTGGNADEETLRVVFRDDRVATVESRTR